MSVCLYGRTEGQTKSACYKFRSNSPIFKIIFLFERYDIRYLYLIYFVRLSVRTYGRMDGQTKSACYKFRFDSPIFKIRFLFERFDTRYLYFINCVCLSVRTDGRMDRKNRPVSNSVLTVRLSKLFFCLKGMTPDTYI